MVITCLICVTYWSLPEEYLWSVSYDMNLSVPQKDIEYSIPIRISVMAPK